MKKQEIQPPKGARQEISPAMQVMVGSLLFGAEQASTVNSPEFYPAKHDGSTESQLNDAKTTEPV